MFLIGLKRHPVTLLFEKKNYTVFTVSLIWELPNFSFTRNKRPTSTKSTFRRTGLGLRLCFFLFRLTHSLRTPSLPRGLPKRRPSFDPRRPQSHGPVFDLVTIHRTLRNGKGVESRTSLFRRTSGFRILPSGPRDEFHGRGSEGPSPYLPQDIPQRDRGEPSPKGGPDNPLSLTDPT